MLPAAELRQRDPGRLQAGPLVVVIQGPGNVLARPAVGEPVRLQERDLAETPKDLVHDPVAAPALDRSLPVQLLGAPLQQPPLAPPDVPRAPGSGSLHGSSVA